MNEPWLSVPAAMPTVTVAFELDDRFVGGSSPENDQAWNALIPVKYHLAFETIEMTDN